MSHERAVQQVLARYVRATDRRDGQALSALFTESGTPHISHKGIVQPEALGELVGREAIDNAISNMMKPHPKNGWSHHSTHDTIIEVNGDSATLDAQFVVFNVVGAESPGDGWPAGTFGAQGTITPIESGYYDPASQEWTVSGSSSRGRSTLTCRWHLDHNLATPRIAILRRMICPS